MRTAVWPVLALLLAMLPPAVHAGEIIRSASQLAKDKPVKELEKQYSQICTANVVYERCSNEYGITEEQKLYIKAKYDDIAKDYMDAFTQAYISRFHAPPPKELTADFGAYIASVQQTAVSNMLSYVDNKKRPGCTKRPVREIVAFYTKLQQSEAAAAASPVPQQ